MPDFQVVIERRVPNPVANAAFSGDNTISLAFRAPSVRLPPQDDIEKVAAKMGWVNDWGIMSYLQLLVNSANTQAGRWEIAVQDCMFLECQDGGTKGWRKLFGNPKDQSFDTSGLKIILFPHCAEQHWQLFLLDRERKEVRAYCSLRHRIAPADYKVSTTTTISDSDT
jgi:hypothetical protein